ncbi:MAG TPA: AmmeMemoRadiSam system radical SAM enzyme [Firmicutes bacterium]|nr:AmmeMemoRadiSam system radical SAM enzyme [Bacillota bacterium]
MNKEALFYEVNGDKIHCHLCPHSCVLKADQRGICKVRIALQEDELKLYTENYAEITSLAVDPIEKKPLYEFHSGSMVLSIGSFGCNFTCSFCQNHAISQVRPQSTTVTPDHLLQILDEVDEEVSNNIGVAFTYNEPSIWFEYVLDCAKLIKTQRPQKKIVMVTNGFINEEPLNALLPYVDAFNIDLKGNDDYYRTLCTGRLHPVMDSITRCVHAGKHVEVTTLLVQDENTDIQTITQFGDFLANLNPNIPIHLSRYFPNYKLENEATSLAQMKQVYDYLSGILTHVYVGNVSQEEKEHIMGNQWC